MKIVSLYKSIVTKLKSRNDFSKKQYFYIYAGCAGSNSIVLLSVPTKIKKTVIFKYVGYTYHNNIHNKFTIIYESNKAII